MGFESEYYDVESLARLDTGNDVTIIAQDDLGVQVDSRNRVLFNSRELYPLSVD